MLGFGHGAQAKVLAHPQFEWGQPDVHLDGVCPAVFRRKVQQARFPGVEFADRFLAVGFEIVEEKTVEPGYFGAGDHKGKLELPALAPGRRGLPAAHHVGHGGFRSHPRRIEGREQHHDHHQQGGENGGHRRVVQVHRPEQSRVHERLADALSQQIAQGDAQHRVHARLGYEEQGDVRRRQPHRRVDADLAKALVDRPQHGVQHDQRGDEHGHQQRAQPFDAGRADRGVRRDGDLVAPGFCKAGEQGGDQPHEVILHQLPPRFPILEADRHRVQVSAHFPQRSKRHDQHVFRLQMGERPHLAGRLFASGSRRYFGAKGSGHGEREVHRGEGFVVQIADAEEFLGVDDAAHHQFLAQQMDPRPSHFVWVDSQIRGHRIGHQAGGLVRAGEETAGCQRPVQPGDLPLRRGEPHQPRDLYGALLVGDFDVGPVLLARLAGGDEPAARADDAVVAEVGADVVEGGPAEPVPAQVAHQDALVRARVLQGNRDEADSGLEGGEREHGEGQQDQRHQRQRGPQFAPAHVGDPQHERRIGCPDPADIHPVHPGRLGLELLHVPFEAAGDYGDHEGRHGHDGERE